MNIHSNKTVTYLPKTAIDFFKLILTNQKFQFQNPVQIFFEKSVFPQHYFISKVV